LIPQKKWLDKLLWSDRLAAERPWCKNTIIVKSKDIHISLRDVQYLPLFSPRLSNAAKEVSDSYDEQSNYVNIYTKEGEIDFIMAARLTRSPVVTIELLGQSLLMETPAKIVTKKLFFRVIDFQVRNIFDTACILQRELGVLFNALDVYSSKLDILEERVKCVSSFYAKQAKEMVIEPNAISAIPINPRAHVGRDAYA
jgi:hypothetical protein